jgi:hypothetical protein
MKSLFDYYKEHRSKVSDKWSSYLTLYENIFSERKNSSVSYFEIGVQNGGSLEIMSEYFPKAQVLVGCDINDKCAELAYDDKRIHLIVGDVNSDYVKQEILKISENFDIIVDDGSHTSADIVKSFANYFSHINWGGVYIVEDLHCSYWSEFDGGLFHPYSSIAFFKRLVDILNYEHWGIVKNRNHVIQGFFKEFSIEISDEDLAQIHSIEFFNSVCIIRKKTPDLNLLGYRVVSGKTELVEKNNLSFDGSLQLQMPQISNFWSTIENAPEETWLEHAETIANQNDQINFLNQEIANQNARHQKSLIWRITKPIRLIEKIIKKNSDR